MYIVQRDVPKHDEHAVVRIFLVAGGDLPLGGCERANPFYQLRSLAVEAVHFGVEIKLQQCAVLVIARWLVTLDVWIRIAQHEIETTIDQWVDCGQMYRVLVCRPHTRRGAPFAELWWHFINQLANQSRSASEVIDNRLNL